jgi:ABC-type uncharacterized transport system permease subunit
MQGLNFTTAILYFLAALAAWWPIGAGRGESGARGGRTVMVVAGLGMAIALHGVALYVGLFGGDGLNLGFSHAISLIAWLTVASYVLLGRDARLTRLAALYLTPAAIVAVLLPGFVPAQRVVAYAGDWAFRLHFVVAIVAYALFTVAALHALLMLFLEKRLHEGAALASGQALPPLLKVERLLFQLLTFAFVLLTLTLVSGVFFSEHVFGKPFTLTHKTVFAVMSWLIFGGLLVGHWRFGWRGKLAVRWTLLGFGMLLFSYVGSKFVLEIILKRV